MLENIITDLQIYGHLRFLITLKSIEIRRSYESDKPLL